MEDIEEKLLSEYIAESYPGCEDMRESIRKTLGFRIHIISHYQKELGDAIKDRMQKAKESFIKKFLQS